MKQKNKNGNVKQVKAKLNLLNHQFLFVKSTAPFPALVGGFGCGKTESLLYRCLSHIFVYGPLFKKHGCGVYSFGLYEPTFDLVTIILFPRLEELLSTYNINYTLNKTEKIITLHDLNAKIILRTMENPEKIIGYETSDAIIDELDTLKEEKAAEVFQKILARNRKAKPDGKPNTVGVTTTPEGFKFVYKTWKLTKEPEKYVIIQGKTKNNIYLPDDYIPNLLGLYPANKLKAYLEGEFVNLVGNTVYDTFNRELSNFEYKLNQSDTIHIGMDFNVGKMSAVISVIKDKKMYVFDEIFGVLDTPAMIKEINSRYKGRNIIIYPDASGRSRKSVDASKSDLSLLKDYFIVKARSKNPGVKNRVMSVQTMFLNMKGERNLFVYVDKCKNLVDNLEQQVYDSNGDPDKSNGQDHMLDALGYSVYWNFPLGTSGLKVISSPV